MIDDHLFIDVKRGKVSPLDYAWFGQVFPNSRLIVVNQREFEADRVKGMTFEQLLSTKEW